MKNASRIAAIAGTCVAAVVCGCTSTERVTLNALPIEVRATLDNATFGGTVTEIERQVREEGPVVYVADATIKNQLWEIEIDENGNLLSKEVTQPDPDKKQAKMTSEPDAPPYKWW